VRLAAVEAHAAVAQAAQNGRISGDDLRAGVAAVALLLDQCDLVEVDDELVAQAGVLAEARALRAYDAVHLAAALVVADADLVLVAGDRSLLAAAAASGLATAPIR